MTITLASAMVLLGRSSRSPRPQGPRWAWGDISCPAEAGRRGARGVRKLSGPNSTDFWGGNHERWAGQGRPRQPFAVGGVVRNAGGASVVAQGGSGLSGCRRRFGGRELGGQAGREEAAAADGVNRVAFCARAFAGGVPPDADGERAADQAEASYEGFARGAASARRFVEGRRSDEAVSSRPGGEASGRPGDPRHGARASRASRGRGRTGVALAAGVDGQVREAVSSCDWVGASRAAVIAAA